MNALRHFFLLMLLAPYAIAQPVVPASIESVVSGGYWETPGHHGRYRVLVVNEGFEHVTSKVFVQWVAEASSPVAGPVVVATKQIQPLFSGAPVSLIAEIKAQGKNRAQISLRGVNSITQEPVSASFTVGAPGQVTVATPNQAFNALAMLAGTLRRYGAPRPLTQRYTH